MSPNGAIYVPILPGPDLFRVSSRFLVERAATPCNVSHNEANVAMSSLPANPDVFPASGRAAAAGAADGLAELQVEVLALFDELRDRLLRYAVSFGLPVHDGEDVLQEVFLALFRHLSAGRARENLHGWAYRTTHNLALKRRAAMQHEWRRVQEPQVLPDGQADPVAGLFDTSPGPEEQLIFRERQERMRAVFKALPESDQVCLRLRADGLRYREIATTVGISLGSVAASLARSFRRLERTDSR